MSSYFDHESLNIDSNKNSTTAESRLYIISPSKKNENLRKNNSKYSVDKLINDNRDSSSESKINNNNNNNLDNNLDNNNNNNLNIYNYKDISNVPDNPANYPILGLVRFGPIPWVNFGTAKFIRNNGPTFERILLLRNPTSANINVHFSSPDRYSGFDLSTLDYDVPPNSIIPIKIFWKPTKIGNVRQNLTVKFNEIRLKCVLFATGTEKIGVKDVEVKTEFYTGIDKETGERKVQVSSLILQNETDCMSEILRTKERRIRESSKESFRRPQQTKVENLPEIKDFSENNPCKIRRVNTKPIETTTITTKMKTTAETKEKEHLIEALRTKNQSFIINNNSSKNNVKYRKLYPKMPFRRSSSVNTGSASATKNSIDFLSNSSEDTSQTISLNRLARQALSVRNKGESTSKTTRSQGIQGPFTKKHRASSANSANTDLRISREFLGNAIRSLSSNSPDERAAEKQQAAFTTWINYMFKNEADSETEKPLSKFNKKTLTPKVLVILKKRNKMRLCVQKYFQDQRKYLSHVYEEIELGKLAIADEKFIYEDLGIRQAVLNLLLNYVPEYLQLGLEVMFNTIISIPINTQEYEKVLESALSQFITKEFLFDRTLAEKYEGHVKCFYREGFKETLEKLILNRILTLFWLLDRLKIRGFLDNIGVPYLFKKESIVKSSNQMCSLFMNSYLKCEGEVMRHLSKLNYHLYYQQSSVDEFDFRVNDLTVDLCDGIRLARLGDILSQKLPKGSHIPTKSNKNGILTIPGHGNPCEGFKYHSLNSSTNTSTHSNDLETISHIDNPHFFEENSRSCLSSLRIPVHSRLQKIHNTNLAFNQLHACGVPVVNFDSKDIVDANRNKILLLLWSIILHCEIPTLLSENCLYDEVSSLKSIINKSEHSEILKKCLTSQSEPNSCIGYNNSLFPLLLEWTQLICAHFNYIVQNFTYSFSDGQAFCYLIAYYVPEILDSRKIQTNTTSALLYEKFTDGKNSGLSSTLEKKLLPKSERSLDGNWIGIFSPPHDTSSTTKQALEAEYSNYKLIRDSTKKIGYVPYILRALDMSNTIPDEKVVILFLSYLFPRLIQVQKERQAAIVLQKIIRNWQKKDTLGVTHASIAIQRVYRGFRSRKIFAGKRQAAQTLKKFFMAYKYRKEFKHHIEKLQSSIRLQAIIRGVCTARHYRIDINRVIRLQSYIRARLEYKNVQIMKKKYQWGSTCIQTLYRTYVQKNYYRALIRSAITIQSNYRGSVVRRKVLELKAAIRIQAFIRGHHQRQVFIRINNAALRIQDIYRNLRSRDRFLLYYKELLKASLIFQANYRRIKQSKEFHLIKSAALIIQCNWRGQLARQKVVILMSTIKIQAFFRMKNAKLHLRSLLKASITLQSALRGMIGRKYVEHMKKQRCLAVLKVQSWWRMTQEMNQYKLKKASAIMIQAICRGNFARRELRKVLAAIRIQSFIRMQNQKKQFKLTKEASLTIQSIWRGHKCRDYVRKWKHERDIAITKIQSQIRMIKQRNEYDNIRKFSIKLQSVIRGILCRIGIKKVRFAIILQKFIRMQNQKKQFKLTKEASLTIQSIWRGQKCREYVEQYSRNRLKSALLIQSLYRMNKERSRLSSLKKCSMILQSAARGFLSRKQFLFTKSVRSIQSFVKMIQARNHYINVVKSAIVIQCRFRCNKFYSEFSRLKKAALVLQRKSRQLKIYRSFKKVKESSIVLQACTRGFLIRKRISEIRKNLAKEQQHRENTIVFLQKQIRSWIVHKNNLKLQAISRFRKLISRRRLTSALQKLNMNIILIQSAIRGHMVRRNLHQTQIETLRKRISENIKDIPMSETLGYKTYRALSVLKNGKYVSYIIEACSTLELASRYSLACAKYILDLNAIPKLFEVSNECNRSDPHISIINSILDIIHNILSFNELSLDVWKQYTDIPNVIIDMMCKFKDNSVTYTKAASVLLLFAKNVPQWFIERSGQTSNSITCNNSKRLSKLLRHQKKRVSMDQRARRYVTIISKTIECMRITEVLCEIFIEHSITTTTTTTTTAAKA